MKLEKSDVAPLFSNTDIPDIFFQNTCHRQMVTILKYICICYFYQNMIKI